MSTFDSKISPLCLTSRIYILGTVVWWLSYGSRSRPRFKNEGLPKGLTFNAVSSAMGVFLDIGYCLFIVPVFAILAALPISYGGWGVRELTSVQLFGLIGIGAEQALVISMLYGFGILISSLPGVLTIRPFIRATKDARAAYILANNKD